MGKWRNYYFSVVSGGDSNETRRGIWLFKSANMWKLAYINVYIAIFKLLVLFAFFLYKRNNRSLSADNRCQLYRICVARVHRQINK